MSVDIEDFIMPVMAFGIVAFSIWMFMNAEPQAARFRERASQTYGDRTSGFFFTAGGVRIGAIAGVLAGLLFVATGISNLLSA